MTSLRTVLVLLIAVAAWAAPSADALQTASAPALKAAYLLNFVRFTEWPAAVLAPGAPITLCVVNNRAVSSFLADLTAGRLVEGHALVVATPKPDALASCHLLFASDLDSQAAAALMASVAGKPVLTVSDMDKFAERGGVADLFVDHGTIGFAINLAAAQRAGVRLSHKLLSLAKIVKEDRDAGR
jgi:hypothetical protein